jgi:hypothetical protein
MSKFSVKSIDIPKMLGQAIFYSSIQASLGSVEMSSKFSVINFAKDDSTLQNAANALKSYIFIAMGWTIATMLVMYAQYGYWGAFSGFLFNMFYILWIYTSYVHSFNIAAEKYHLVPPCMFWCSSSSSDYTTSNDLASKVPVGSKK